MMERLRGAESCCRREDFRVGAVLGLMEVWFTWAWSPDLPVGVWEGVEEALEDLEAALLS